MLFGCQAIRLDFITGYSDYGQRVGFNIHYYTQDASNADEHCGNNSFDGPSGIITSPGFPHHYPNGINSTCAIKAGRNKSALIEVVFFDLQPGSSRYIDGRSLYECNHDWLEFSCSSEDAVLANQLSNRTFCGTQRPFTMLLRGCEHVFIYFYTDSTAAFSGFRIRYKIYSRGEECGNTVFSDSTGIITSPGYPGPYPHQINCTYYIEVGSSNALSIRLRSFDVGCSQRHHYHWPIRCVDDWIRITCSSYYSREAPFASHIICGKDQSFSTKFRHCNRYALEFFSGGNYSKAGFELRYTITTPEEECGRREFSNSTGIITSPGFPSYYEPHLDCTYYIDVGRNLLFLRFLHFYIGEHHNYYPCPRDWLQITCVSRRRPADASIAPNANINKKLCGERLNFSITMDGCSRAAIQFFTNDSHPMPGFKLQYSINRPGYCGYSSNNFTDAEGAIVSPYLLMGSHIPTTSCNYLISAQQMSTISLAITVMPTIMSCIANWLSIKCLDERKSLSYSPKLCEAKYLHEKVVLPSCSSVKLIYPSTNYDIQFVINYRVESPEEVCGKSVFTKPTGYISFPKFSPKYVTKFNCSYSVDVGAYNSISFELSSFVDTDGNNETFPNDWISIFCHGNNDNGKNRITHKDSIQSKKRMTLSFTNCSTVDIVFHSENQVTKRRFNVSYTIGSNHITKESSPTSSSATSTSSSVTITSSLATTFSSTSKFICPEECIAKFNKTVVERPANPSDQTATEEPLQQTPQAQRFVQTESFGVLIAFIVLLILVSLVALTVVWWRRRGTKPKEVENTLTVENSESINLDLQEKRRQGRFNLRSFDPFRSQSRGNQDRQMGFVPLEPMASSLSGAYSEQSIQSNPNGVSNDKITILK